MPTVYTIRGKTKEKLLISFRELSHNFRFIIGDGEFNINFPYIRDGKI